MFLSALLITRSSQQQSILVGEFPIFSPFGRRSVPINHNWSVFAISRMGLLRARMSATARRGVSGGCGGVSLCKCTRKPDARSTHPLSAPRCARAPRHYKTFTTTIYYLFAYRLDCCNPLPTRLFFICFFFYYYLF